MSSSTFNFIGLPPELRIRVYTAYMYSLRTETDPHALNICFLCRQIRAEYEVEVYEANKRGVKNLKNLFGPPKPVKFTISLPSSFRDFTTASITVLSPRRPLSREHSSYLQMLRSTFLRTQLPHLRTLHIYMRPGSMLFPSCGEYGFKELKARTSKYGSIVIRELGQYMMPVHTYDVPRNSYITQALIALPGNFWIDGTLYGGTISMRWRRGRIQDASGEDMTKYEAYYANRKEDIEFCELVDGYRAVWNGYMNVEGRSRMEIRWEDQPINPHGLSATKPPAE